MGPYLELEGGRLELATIGLTPTDVEKRGIAAVGYCSKELLPPYYNPGHERKSTSILKFISDHPDVVTFSSFDSISLSDWTSSFPNSRVIQVVGGYTSICVAEAVLGATRSGFFVLVDPSLTFENRPYFREDILMDRLKERVMTTPNMSKLSLGRQRHIFYRSGITHK